MVTLAAFINIFVDNFNFTDVDNPQYDFINQFNNGTFQLDNKTSSYNNSGNISNDNSTDNSTNIPTNAPNPGN